jgi:hypothetical protein
LRRLSGRRGGRGQGDRGWAKEAPPAAGHEPGRLDSRGWRHEFTLRSHIHPRPPPHPPPRPLPRWHGSSGAGMGSRSDLRGRQERLGKARARKPRKSGPGPRNTFPAIALSARPAGPDNGRVSVAFRACDALRCIRNRQSSRWTGPNHGPPRLEQGAEKAVRPPAGNIFPTRGRDCPFGREQETHCVSPAGAGRFPVDRQVQAQQRPAPDPAGEKRPPGAGRALAGGFGPPAGLGSAWRCGRGDGPCHCSGARRRKSFPRSGQQPMRGALFGTC